MALISSFTFPSRVTVKPYLSSDQYNQHTYGTSVSYRARIQYKTELFRDGLGDESLLRAVVYLHTDDITTVTTKSQIILPNGEIFPILFVEPVYGATDSIGYLKLAVGRRQGE